MKRSFIVGTAGHIDHGKTALVKAITGVDTDRLPEEKARGITIDLGFAHTELEGLDISFIDVPGHERFVRNMLAGIGGIDLLMLVVAADESVMPQTREHFDICRLLQISTGVIVITKKDLVDQETLDVVSAEIKELVAGSFLENASVFNVSSKTGEGIEELKAGVSAILRKRGERGREGIFRLPVDRVFVLKGHGTVVTGTLISGNVRKESIVEALPSHRKVKIRSIHAHDRKVDEAFAGQRTALNLLGIDKEEIERGETLTVADFFEPTSLLDCKIHLLESAKPLAHNAVVRLHVYTTDVLARITLIGREMIQPGESAYAQIRLQRPIFVLYSDRFILRKHSPLITIGGGIILDHMPGKRLTRGATEALQPLQSLESSTLSQRLAYALEQRAIRGATGKYLKAKLAATPERILRAADQSVLVLRNDPLLMISKEAAEKLTNLMRQGIKQFHESNPLLPGIPKEELRTKYLPGISNDLFDAVLNHAISKKILSANKEVVSLYGRRVALNVEEQKLADAVEAILLQSEYGVAGIEETAQKMKQAPEEINKILHLLAREGKVLKVADDYFIHRQSWQSLKSRITGLKSKQKTLSVPEFKAIFGISRKYAIPLLERLDREGITRRSGNERIIL